MSSKSDIRRNEEAQKLAKVAPAQNGRGGRGPTIGRGHNRPRGGREFKPYKLRQRRNILSLHLIRSVREL